MFIIVSIIRIFYNYNIIQDSPPTPSLHHSHHYQWFRQENFLTTLRVGHQMNFSSLDANFLSINIIFISIKIINSNITINTYYGVNWRSHESLEIIESARKKHWKTKVQEKGQNREGWSSDVVKRLTAPKQMNFRKTFKGGGVIFNPKIYILDFGTSNRAFRAWNWYQRVISGFRLCFYDNCILKHCQRHYGPRRWLLWPVILVW